MLVMVDDIKFSISRPSDGKILEVPPTVGHGLKTEASGSDMAARDGIKTKQQTYKIKQCKVD